MVQMLECQVFNAHTDTVNTTHADIDIKSTCTNTHTGFLSH